MLFTIKVTYNLGGILPCVDNQGYLGVSKYPWQSPICYYNFFNFR